MWFTERRRRYYADVEKSVMFGLGYCVWKVVRAALYSRILLWLLQVTVNLLPDHEPSRQDVYLDEKRTPLHPPLVQLLFGGFGNWDSEYFLMISEHGYIYEQSLAFFPFLPSAVRTLSAVMSLVLGNTPIIPLRSLHLILGWLINNFVAFPIAVLFVYKMTQSIYGNAKMATVTALLFIINPASIFFCSVYSEAIFSMFIFGAMLALNRGRDWMGMVLFMIGGAVRSNALLAVIFIAYHQYGKLVSFGFSRQAIVTIFSCLVQCLCLMLPFILFQLHGYSLYCPISDDSLKNKMAAFLLAHFPKPSDIHMPSETPDWCASVLPFSYGSIQSNYWNNGFLRYYELKQIPNFLLATPIVVLSGLSLCNFCHKFGGKWRQLLFPVPGKGTRIMAEALLPYQVHLGVMLAFGLTAMHIQVLTRFIASSTPVVLWYAAERIVALLDDGGGSEGSRAGGTATDRSGESTSSCQQGRAVSDETKACSTHDRSGNETANDGYDNKPVSGLNDYPAVITDRKEGTTVVDKEILHNSGMSVVSKRRKDSSKTIEKKGLLSDPRSIIASTQEEGLLIVAILSVFWDLFISSRSRHSAFPRTASKFDVYFCKVVLVYFVAYIFIGFTLHCNFYPWT